MIVTAVKTEKITAGSIILDDLLAKNIHELKEGSVVAITSKVVALCEGRVVPIGSIDKQELVKRESDFYVDELTKYGFNFTITHGTLVPVAGIDESNGNGQYVLWPADPQISANEVRQYLKNRFNLQQVGVVITDSTARPLHFGTEGVAIGFAGFKPINNYVGQKDLFGRPFTVSMANIPDALASAAVLAMGEGTEQTPIVIIEDLPSVKFDATSPTQDEMNQFFIGHVANDMFAPFLKNAPWKKGGRQN